MDAMQLKTVDPPIVIESQKILLTGALFRAKQFRQSSGHPKMPPIAIQDRAHNAAHLQYRLKKMKPRAKRVHAFVHPQKFELDAAGLAKDPFSHLFRQLNFLLQSFRQRIRIRIESNTYPEMAATPDGIYRSPVNKGSRR